MEGLSIVWHSNELKVNTWKEHKVRTLKSPIKLADEVEVLREIITEDNSNIYIVQYSTETGALDHNEYKLYWKTEDLS